ncbi:reverse transcriptase domain-containing protein, partial [Tanacetum coccineum]
AFRELKHHLSKLPTLVAPRPQEELIMYVSASHGAVGAVLMTERDMVQTPKWSVMLGEHNITYRPRTSVKGQILADFLVEKLNDAPADTSVKETPKEIAAQMGVRHIQANVDSNLVSGFDSFSISHVSRSKNKKADALSKIASTNFVHLSKQVLVEILNEKSINEKEVAAVVEEEESTWMTPIVEYLRDETLPEDRKDASKLRIKARQYELLQGVLYRRSFLKPWLQCVRPLQADYF